MSFNEANKAFEHYQDFFDPANEPEIKEEEAEVEKVGVCETCGKNVWGYQKDEQTIIVPCIHYPDHLIAEHNKNVVRMVNDAMGRKP